MYNLIKREAIYLDAPKILMKKTENELDPDVEYEKTIKDAEEKARKILENANNQAKELLEKAKKEYEDSQKKAREILENAEKKTEEMKKALREEIERTLKAEYEKKHELQIKKIEEVLSEISKERNLIIEKVIQRLIEIFKLFLEKVSLDIPKINEQIFRKKLQTISEQLIGNQKIILKLSIDDKTSLTEEIMLDLKNRFKSIDFKFDDSLQKGDMVVETDTGLYNFTTSEALNILKDILDEEFNEN